MLDSAGRTPARGKRESILTREQLQATRAERWRQNGEALLTLEAARDWMQETGICLFLPRKMQLPAPAPSFVEACQGETNATPAREAIEAATALLVRLIDAGDVVALNLLGMAGEQPDFLVTPEFLPYIFALRGDRDWKHDPPSTGNGRVSPLVLEVWKTIERTGVQTAIEIRETLGKELTEAAVLRALNELWTGMRIIVLPGEGDEPATWEALKTRYEKAMAAGTATSLVTALSVLLARYLQSAVAATSEQAEIFLSPLASRSKVREVIRGLSATRQLETYSLDAQPLLYVEGTLPEFGEPVVATDIEALPAGEGSRPRDAATPRIRTYARRPVTGPDPLRWKRDSSVPLPAGARRSSTGDAARDEARGSKPEAEKFAARRRPASTSDRPATGRPATGRPASGPRREGTGAPRRASADGEKKRWTPREGSSAERPRREGGFSKPAGRPAGRPPTGTFTPRREGGAAGETRRPASGLRPTGSKPGFGSRPPAARGFGARPSGPRATGRIGTGRSFGKSAESGEKRRFSRSAASDSARTDRPSSDRSSSERPSYGRPAGDRPRYPKSGGSKFGPRRAAGAAPGEGAGSAKKGRWVPRTGAGDRREERPQQEGGFAGPSGRVSPRSGSGTRTGGPGARPTSSRPSFGSRGAGSRGTASRGTAPRSFPARPSYVKPWAESTGRAPRPTGSGANSDGKRARPEGTFERKRPASGGTAGTGERRPRTFGARPSTGKAGFKPRSGGRTAGGRTGSAGKPGKSGKRRAPGDYPPRKKRPE